MKKLPKKVGEEKIVFQGKMMEVANQEYKAGDYTYTLEFVRRAPGVRLIIKALNNKFLIAKEFRTEFDGWDYRLPGGKVFDSLAEYNDFLKKGEDIQEAARKAAVKEAEEEMGIILKDFTFFATSKCGVTVEWDLHYFVVEKYENHPNGQNMEPDENIEIQEVTPKELKDICLGGEMKEDRSAAMLIKYLHKTNKL